MDELGPHSDPAARPSARRWPFRAAVVAIFALHAGLTIQLFGRDDPLGNLLSAQPVTSGRHPLHGYRPSGDAGSASVGYDPTCYAGVLRSSVAGFGTRLTHRLQRHLGLCGGPAEYKIRLAVICWSLPVAVFAGGLLLRLGRPSLLAAAGASVVVAWSAPAARIIDNGDVYLSLVGVSAVVAWSLLGRWHQTPSLPTWLGLTACHAVGWAVMPPLWLAFTALSCAWWAVAGRRHRWRWNAGLALSVLIGAAASFPAWGDWLSDWWIRLPASPAGSTVFVADATYPGPGAGLPGPTTWFTAGAMVAAGLVGGTGRWMGGRCPSAVAAAAAAIAISVSVSSATRSGSSICEPADALALALWLAVLPASVTATRPAAGLWPAAGRHYVGMLVGGGLLLLVTGLVARTPPPGDPVEWGPRPLAVGLPAEARRLEGLLRETTTPTARILWEDLARRADLGWAALLPRRLGRPFIGGADPNGELEHTACALRDGNLAGRRLATWTDVELDAYCRRYNVGWVVCATDPAGDRFARWSNAVPVPTPDGTGGWRVFQVRRPHSFILKGHAERFEADDRRMTLTNVVPEDGEVVVSLHFHAGCGVRPGWVRVERDLDPYDPIPFIRLCMREPVSRVTVTWDAR